jgi:hypothetical protein
MMHANNPSPESTCARNVQVDGLQSKPLWGPRGTLWSQNQIVLPMKGTTNKLAVLTGLLVTAPPAVFGQGTIDVGNINRAVGFVQPIFDANPANVVVQQTGDPSSTIYSGAILGGVTGGGTTVYGGAPLMGTGYEMVFFVSLDTSVTSISQMSVATTIPFRTSASATAAPAGLAIGIPQLAITLPGATGGTSIAFAYGAFNTFGGSVTSWAQAQANFNSIYGSDLAEIGVGHIATTILNGYDTAGVLHSGNTSDQGWTSFSLEYSTLSPEPSTVALAALGAVLMQSRRLKLLLRHLTSRLHPIPRSSTRDQ